MGKHEGIKFRRQLRHLGKRLAFPLLGIAASLWYIFRVLPKPKRAAYPCQRVAAPIAAGFWAYLAALVSSLVFFKKFRFFIKKYRYGIAAMCLVLGLVFSVWQLALLSGDSQAAVRGTEPPNTPMGTARGIHPGRVAWVYDQNATLYSGSGYWYQDTSINQTVVEEMLSKSVRWLTGETTDTAAWSALFRYFNQVNGGGDVGYQAGEKITIKINLNNSTAQGTHDNKLESSPQLILAVLKQLVNTVGVAQANISVYDAVRPMPDMIYTKCSAVFPSVLYIDNTGGNGRTKVAFESNAIKYSSSAVTSTGSKQAATCALQAKYLINMALMKGHIYAGITLCGKNHFGSTNGPSGLHGTVSGNQAMGSYNNLVDLGGHKRLGGKTLLYLIDALYTGNRQDQIPTKMQMAPFNNDYCSSLFASQDWLAIDSVGHDFLKTEWSSVVMTNPDNYLHEGALADNPPSGITYDPEGDGVKMTSLGVHEHWNNSTDKKYTRNLGTGLGIELINSAPVSNAKDDVTGSFTSLGVWSRNSDTGAWAKLHDTPASQLRAGDFNGNGKEDLLGVWTTGIWLRDDSGVWSKLLDSTGLKTIAAGDMNGDGKADLVGSWDTPAGVWQRDSASGAWTQLHSVAAATVACGDFDKNGKDDLLGVWTGIGIWIRSDAGVWKRVLDDTDLVCIATGDMTGDGYADVVGSWENNVGTWSYDVKNNAWARLHDPAQQIAAGDLDGDGKADLIGKWSGIAGIWVKYTAGGLWKKIIDDTGCAAISFCAGKMR